MSQKKCPACGASVDTEATICNNCGASIIGENSQYQERYTYGNAQSPFSYLKQYYQEEFQKISSSNEIYRGKFNWCAFFFTWIWGFTKGLWGLSLVTLALEIILSYLKVAYAGLAISLLWGVRGNYCYYNLLKNNKQFLDKF